MPDAAIHIAAATDDEALARKLVVDSQNRWAVIVAFYSALHWVDAYLAVRHSIHPQNHAQRDTLVARYSDFNPIEAKYERLQVRSRWARYDVNSFTRLEVTILLDRDLADIRDHIQRLLSR